MRILMVTPESNPFARTGGLAEVIYGLAAALLQLGHKVTVVLPLYRQVREQGLPLTPTGHTLSIPMSFKSLDAEIYTAGVGDPIEFYFISQDRYYNREALYGTCYGDFEDNGERFIFFSRAVMEMIEALELDFDVCHCHEWQTGLVPVYCRTLYQDRPRLGRLPVVYTVHNVGYQGLFSTYDLPLTGLGWDLLTPNTLEFYGKINLMKAGLVFADLLSTVSNKYREEIMTPEYGFGLDGVFRQRAPELFGILEGVDYQRWDPSRDTFLAKQYDRDSLEAKAACKADLIKQFSLPMPLDRPLLGMTTRLFERKGVDLVENILDDLMQLEVGFVLQGTGEERHEYLLQEISQRHPDRIGIVIGYTDELAHKIIAGSDIFLMPSRYEPGGLDQLYCLRYGTLPVVRATGGLDETIQEYDPQTGEGTGFKFTGYTPAELLGAIQRALALIQDQAAWKALLRKNMTLDFSWDSIAPKYLELYEAAREKRTRLLKG